MKSSPLAAFTRIGPSPPLTLVALLATGVEAFVFNRLHETRIPGLFQVLLYSSLLWFWLSIVWGLWLAVHAVERLKLPKAGLMVARGITGFAFFALATAYLLNWIIFSQINAFPDANWFRFLQSGYEVVWQEVQRSSSRALTLFYMLCGLTLVVTPFVYWLGMRGGNWLRGDVRRALLPLAVWLVVGATALGSLLAISSDREQSLRQTKITRFSNSVNPAITMAASLLAPYRYEAIKPDLNTATLEPRLPDEKLYADAKTPENALSVIYVAVESLRGDLLFREHQGKEIMPNLNALARRSAVFSRAYAQSTHTDYSIPSYLSGQYPLRSQSHFYYDQGHTWPKAQIYEHLHHYGYRTAIISADTTNWGELRSYLVNEHLDVFFDAENLPTTYTATSADRGYVTNFRHTPRTETKAIPDKELVDFNIAWIQIAAAEGKPWFLYTFFYQPHYPYKIGKNDPRPFQPSEMDFNSTFLWFPPEKMHVMLNAYANAVHEMDAQFGRLIKYLEDNGIMESTAIVVTGDHGEAFGEHGVVTHAGPLFEEVVRVPLIYYAPGLEPQMLDYPAQHVDAAPTLCGLLNVPVHPGFQGLDLLNTKPEVLQNRDVFLHSEPPSSWRGDAVVRAGRWKFWHDRYSDLYYLYDLFHDPDEMEDVKGVFPEIAAELRRALETWRGRQLSYYTFQRYYEQYYPPQH